ncbi:outer membrane lipoprotein-sorting protein, partial [Photobacterium sanctipauli]
MIFTSKPSHLLISAALFALLPSPWALADAAGKGRAIATEIEMRDRGFLDSSAEVEMILTNNTGNETLRKLAFKRLENQDGGDKSLISFNFPADIKGTALLTHPQPNASDEQWLYLPSL